MTAPTPAAAARSKLLKMWRHAYYAGSPVVTDAIYDYHEKKQLAEWPDDPLLKSVGGVLESPFVQVTEGEAMLSLKKTYDAEELRKFIGNNAIVAESKIDGMSLELRYKNGYLHQAVSRGRDGVLGFDVTANALFVKDIPHFIEGFSSEIRGEVIQTLEDFENYKKACLAKGEKEPSHPRNVATGTMQQKDPKVVAERNLRFVGYCIVGQEETFPTEVDALRFLKEKGFTLPKATFYKLASLFTTELASQLVTWQQKIKELPYACDGIVIQYNDRAYRKSLGVATNHPHGARAFKWEDETAEAKVENLTWGVGRTGELTPVANIAETELSGAKISNVTVHHLGYVRANNIKPGSVIKIIRSGEIIPKHLDTISYDAATPFSIPTACPSCSGPLVEEAGQTEGAIGLYCVNPLCPAQQFEKILHYVKVAEIDNLGSGILEALFKQGIVKTIPDLYLLLGRNIDSLLINGKSLGSSRAKKIKLAIEAASVLPLPKFIAALGVIGLGKGTAEKICEKYPTLEQIEKLTVQDLWRVDSFASTKAQTVHVGLQKALPLIGFLKPFVKVTAPGDKSLVLTSVLSGLSFVVTGSFSEENPRKEIEKLITEAGGKIMASPTRFTSYLVQGEGGGSKAEKAAKFNIPILNEQGIIDLLAGRSHHLSAKPKAEQVKVDSEKEDSEKDEEETDNE